jgi:peptidoglycan/xylan/chitin deacetylase (PgdA/CDA1 family)
MQLALKIDFDTLRGTREGLPALLQVLEAQQAEATFLFSVGRDHTGRAIRRVFRPGFFGKVARTSVLEHYGLRTLLYGTVLPGPDIARRAGALMRSASAAGHEVGVHCFDHASWQDLVTRRDEGWARRQMQRAIERFTEVFSEPPRVHGAAGWQMTEAALRAEPQLGFIYASDTRGHAPFMPWVDGRRNGCPQLPTTLPTLDELIGLNGLTAANVHTHLLEQTRARPAHQVFTLHAELEGMKLRPVLERLLAGWREQGYQLVAMRTLLESLDIDQLPSASVQQGTIPGRSGTLAVQGPAVTSDQVTSPAR